MDNTVAARILVQYTINVEKYGRSWHMIPASHVPVLFQSRR
jgi:hypothetical protein